jgi:hypothetical protein
MKFLTERDCAALEAGMKESSRWMTGHDHPVADGSPFPAPTDLKQRIDDLEAWVKQIRKRRENKQKSLATTYFPAVTQQYHRRSKALTSFLLGVPRERPVPSSDCIVMVRLPPLVRRAGRVLRSKSSANGKSGHSAPHLPSACPALRRQLLDGPPSALQGGVPHRSRSPAVATTGPPRKRHGPPDADPPRGTGSNAHRGPSAARGDQGATVSEKFLEAVLAAESVACTVKL